jgi:hypothetical protein
MADSDQLGALIVGMREMYLRGENEMEFVRNMTTAPLHMPKDINAATIASDLQAGTYIQQSERNSGAAVAEPQTERVGVLLPPSLTESFEIVLARINDLAEKGESVSAIVCNGTVRGCVANPWGIKALCRHCVRVRDHAVKQLIPELEIQDVFELSAENASENSQPISPDIEAEIDRSARSTLLTFYRTDTGRPRGGVSGKVFEALHGHYRHYSKATFMGLRCLLLRDSFTRLEFFNGRIVPTRAAMLAAEDVGLNFAAIEVSGSERQLSIFENLRIHDLAASHGRIADFLRSGAADIDVGANFFERRRAGKPTNDRTFTADQIPLEPSHRGENVKLISIFTSSADEMEVAGDQWCTASSRDPVHFITSLCQFLGSDEGGYRIVVRMHPNQAGDRTGRAGSMLDQLQKIRGVHVIPPEDRTSSYDLLDAASAVITFGSTIGLEAAYWGKLSILAGHAAWEKQGVAQIVSTPEEAAEVIRNSPNLDGIKERASLLGAYYMQGTGYRGSLEFEPVKQRFSVNGRNFLAEKRRHLSYWLWRVVDRALRRFV